MRLNGRLEPDPAGSIDYVRTMTIVLRTVGNNSKVTIGKNLIKFESEN